MPFRDPLAAALDHALQHIAAQPTASVGPTVDLATLRQRLDRPLDDSGLDPRQVLDELVQAVEGGIVGSAGGRFFGWVIGGSLPAALAADWMTSVWDQNACLYAAGPAAAVVEETCGRWLKQLLGLPAGASFALTTGCQMAHQTCLAAARNAVLARAGWDVERAGLSAAPPIRILSSEEIHGTAVRTLRMLGLGEANLTRLPVETSGSLSESALKSALEAEPGRSTIVLLQAGDVNLGSFDDFTRLIPLAKAHGAWVHVDGAFGLWAAATPRLRHLLAGADEADSWATDGHKWLNVPYDCGYAFVGGPAPHRAALSARASYLTHALDARDPMDWTPDSSRRARGFATYAALRQLGIAGVAKLVDRSCALATTLVAELARLPGVHSVQPPVINQGLIRFTHPAATSEQENDLFTDRMMAGICASGEAMFTGTTWRGRRYMRVSVSNWQTIPADIDRAVQATAAVLAGLAG
jgi:glutamate/tyrosine decarboxylase-like PLP-dependent enzyme